jgi:hypothetical protein
VIKAAGFLSLALAFPAGAFEFFPAPMMEFSQPVDCIVGTDCFIQKYVDHDSGKGWKDFRCGHMSSNGHDGTDFAIPDKFAMEDGVAVVAAAAGKVISSRDRVSDIGFFPPPGMDCGNGVVLDHGGGWQTQYCHMRLFSVTLEPGDEVKRGEPLGYVGQSGRAEFPHLHFAIRHQGKPVDPFFPKGGTCLHIQSDLWADDIPLKTFGLVSVGISDALPKFAHLQRGQASPDLPALAPALVVWANYYGPEMGDEVVLALTGPEGVVITERHVIERTQARAFRAVGRKLPANGWPPGWYGGAAILLRDGQVVDRKQLGIAVGPIQP